MRSQSLTIALMIAGMFWCPAAEAQDSGRFGVTMGYPASIGFLWHATSSIALRPEVAWTRTTNDVTSTVTFTTVTFPAGTTTTTTTTTTSSNDGWQTSVGASALFYLPKREALRMYLSPRVLYTRTSSTTTSTSPSAFGVPSRAPTTTETTSRGYFVGGSFGAQYALSARFALYGEVGLGATKARTTNATLERTTLNAWTVATRSGVGAIVYFK